MGQVLVKAEEVMIGKTVLFTVHVSTEIQNINVLNAHPIIEALGDAQKQVREALRESLKQGEKNDKP